MSLTKQVVTHETAAAAGELIENIPHTISVTLHSLLRTFLLGLDAWCQPQLFVFLIIFEEKIKIFDRFIEHRHDTGRDNCLINFGGVSKLLSGRSLHTIYYGEETSYIKWHLKDFFLKTNVHFPPQCFNFVSDANVTCHVWLQQERNYRSLQI